MLGPSTTGRGNGLVIPGSISSLILGATTMAKATAPTTMGSILGLVSTTADTATGLVNTVADTIGLASSYVTKVASEQRQRHQLDAVDFTMTLIQERAQAAAMRKVEITKFRKLTPDHAKYYDEAATAYLKALTGAEEGKQD